MSTTTSSKFLSLVLRHQPELIGLTLDRAGWTSVDALLAACAKHGKPLTRADLEALVAASDKQRFALSADGTQIRANQGHSVEVDLALAPRVPPAQLFHGTYAGAIQYIRAEGLVKGERHHVHLSVDLATAKKVGSRRGVPVILTVRAGAMAAAGHVFHCSDNGVWLVEAVPVAFLEFPDMTAGRTSRTQIARDTLAACEAGFYDLADGTRVPIADALADARAATVLYELGAGRALADGAPHPAPTREVTGESTLDACRRLALAHPTAHVGALNFASAKNPGGGFLGGAQAQEEALARSSGLYPCLLEEPQHYARNKANRSALYLDLAIVSPHVPVFRHDDGSWYRPGPVLATIVTCAAPNHGALEQNADARGLAALPDVLRRRARFVLALAAHHGITHLVLGAWGCGVFRNDPALVASAFAIPELAWFAHVTFAIYGDGPNRAAFDAAFP